MTVHFDFDENQNIVLLTYYNLQNIINSLFANLSLISKILMFICAIYFTKYYK